MRSGLIQKTILIIDDDAERAAELQAMIEFLDTPSVVTADSGRWSAVAAEYVLAAVFIGNGMAAAVRDVVHEGVVEAYPGLPVVVVDTEASAA